MHYGECSVKDLAKELVDRIPDLTRLKSVNMALENTHANLPFLKNRVSDINRHNTPHDLSAIIIGAGPSLHSHDPVSTIMESRYKGSIICADGALPYCLRNGLIPDYVVTLDPHPTRIVRWFGDPNLTQHSLDHDDYFRRQDLDPYMEIDELGRNDELIRLVNEAASKINCIIATCVSPSVRDRCIESGMKMYWWNPLYDDVDDHDSLTRKVYDINHAPCLATGGNTGAAAWVFANTILGKTEIALVGMDFGYAPGTPLNKTQYYREAHDLFGEKLSDAFITVYNPHTREEWLTDPTYYWYRQMFLDMVKQAPSNTNNCTQGGILFGEGINFRPLQEFLDSLHSPK